MTADGDFDLIDDRFVDIELELGGLGAYLDLIESEFTRLQEKVVEDAMFGWNLDDPDDAHTAQGMADHAAGANRRLLWGSFVVMAWAVFERGVTEIAREVAKAREIPEPPFGGQPFLERMKQYYRKPINFLLAAFNRPQRLFGGQSFLKRAKRYYRNVLNFPLADVDESHWEQMVRLNLVRNAFAHAAGRLDGLTKKSRLQIENMFDSNVGVSIDEFWGEYLIVHQKFAAATFDAINVVLIRAIRWAETETRRPEGSNSPVALPAAPAGCRTTADRISDCNDDS